MALVQGRREWGHVKMGMDVCVEEGLFFDEP